MTNAISKRQRPSRYTDAEIDRGLFALALAGGNTRRASVMLEEQGFPIPATTLDTWKNRRHPERWERIHAETLPKVRERLADEMEALAMDQIDLEAEITRRIREQLDEIPDRDLSGSLRNVAVARGSTSTRRPRSGESRPRSSGRSKPTKPRQRPCAATAS